MFFSVCRAIVTHSHWQAYWSSESRTMRNVAILADKAFRCANSLNATCNTLLPSLWVSLLVHSCNMLPAAPVCHVSQCTKRKDRLFGQWLASSGQWLCLMLPPKCWVIYDTHCFSGNRCSARCLAHTLRTFASVGERIKDNLQSHWHSSLVIDRNNVHSLRGVVVYHLQYRCAYWQIVTLRNTMPKLFV